MSIKNLYERARLMNISKHIFKTYTIYMVIVSFLMINYSHAVILNTLLHSCIKNQQAALLELEHYLPTIKLTEKRWETEDTRYHECTYWHQSQESLDCLERYRAIEHSLESILVLNSLGDGFIVGILAACCTKMLKSKADKKTIIAVLVGVIAMVLAQKKAMPSVAYIDTYLTRGDHAEIMSTETCAQIVFALFSSGFGYLAANFLIDQFFSGNKN